MVFAGEREKAPGQLLDKGLILVGAVRATLALRRP
jgi:hypothetical protein